MKKLAAVLVLASCSIASASSFTFRLPTVGLKASAAVVKPVGILVTEAYYGTGTASCDATPTLKSTCDGQASCQQAMTNAVCGDPHVNVVKSWYIDYSCKGVPQSRLSGREDQTATLTCN